MPLFGTAESERFQIRQCYHHILFSSSLFPRQDTNNSEDFKVHIVTLGLDSSYAGLCPEEQAAIDCFIPLCQFLLVALL